MKRALISVSNKAGLNQFAGNLIKRNWQIISTGGTFDQLRTEFGKSQVVSVEDYCNTREFLGGRVKTLNEIIHGGLLAKTEHYSELENRGIEPIDMLVCNLYPFSSTIAKSNCTLEDAIENIDIGGVAMLRGAAKNYQRVAVVSNPEHYERIMNILDSNDNTLPEEERKLLALEVFKMTANYDSVIAEYLSEGNFQGRFYEKTTELKYGCNPHQENSAVWSVYKSKAPFKLLNGNPSYINYLDAIGSWQLVSNLHEATGYPSATSFKHTSPAGSAIAAVPLTLQEKKAYEVSGDLSPQALAYVRARNGDPKSSFGDFIACSDTVDLDTAKVIKQSVSDGIVAPRYDNAAFDLLKTKKGGKFIILKADPKYTNTQSTEFRELYGMAVSQEPDYFLPPIKDALTLEELDLLVANISLKYSQSNSVAMAKNGQIVGLGCGQQNRVDCVKLAGNKSEIWHARLTNADLIAELKTSIPKKQDRINKMYELIESGSDKIKKSEKSGSLAMASDGFFPFSDNIEEAAKFGVTHIMQPGGSTADSIVDTACEKAGITHIKTGKRVFYH